MRFHQQCDKCTVSHRDGDAPGGTATLGRSSALRTPNSEGRRGVVLLVVMVLLTLMSLMGLTLVMVTAQGRLSALAASRKGLQSEHDNQELATVMTQVAVGSTDTNSVFGAHGLVEDLYGLPQFFGRIAPSTPVLPVGQTAVGTSFVSGGNNGTLLQLVVIAGAPSGAAGLGPQNGQQYVLPQYSGAFCGQVITMLTGPAAGQSARVTGYYYNTLLQVASLQCSSFGGVVPETGDEFMINGRPFSGTGFGLDLTKFQTGTGVDWMAPYTQAAYGGTVGPLLAAVENPAAVAGPQANMPASGMPYAYLPNHARLGITQYAPTAAGTYWDVAGPGGANEPYDAPDFQNLMLAMHYWDGGSGVVTPIPSMHRPELVGWYHYQASLYTNPAISMANPNMRRKVILRPEPTDHFFIDSNGNGVWDAREPWHDVNGDGIPNDVYANGAPAFLDLNGDGAWTPGETDYTGNTFNPVTGAWYITQNGNWKIDPLGGGLDVDNDQDNVPDSVWVDAGLPVHTESDGTLTKNLAGVLCIDLDGKINLNAHGSLAQLDVFRYPYNPYLNASALDGNVDVVPNPWANPPVDATGVAVVQNTLPGPLNISAIVPNAVYLPPGTGGDAYSVWNQRSVPVGQGYGPADVNLVHLFRRSHGDKAALNYYRVFLQGFDGYPNAPSSLPPVDGRYGESTRLSLLGVPGFNYPGVFPPGEYAGPWTFPFSPLNPASIQQWTQSYMDGPRPGWSQWYDPFSTSLLFASGLTTSYTVNDPIALARFSDIRPHLLEPAILPTTPFFFDFLTATGIFPGHQPTAHGTPSDLHSRGFQMTDVTGRPYYAGTAAMPWQTLPGVLGTPSTTWSGLMDDQSVINYYAGNLVLGPVLQNERVLNEGVDTPYELDPRQNARQGGQNTGNTLAGIPDFASLDSKFSASEFEGILRSHEWNASGTANSSSLVNRLNALDSAEAYLRTGSTAQQTTNLGNDNVRLAMTSDSWDLPVPNIALTPQQLKDVTQYVNYFGQGTLLPLGSSTTSLNLGNVSLVELARARIFADNTLPATLPALPTFNSPGFTQPLPNSSNTALSFADLALFGNLKNTQQNIALFPTQMPPPAPGQAGINPNIPVWPLLAPETVLGMRLDVNRLLGNGIDDNGNGVVDEPMEAAWQGGTLQLSNVSYPYGQSLAYPYSRINTSQFGPVGQQNPNVSPASQSNGSNMVGVLDLNNDGFYPELVNAGGLLGVTSVDPQLTLPLPAPPVYLPGDPTGADMRARQLLARHLYCLAMLLLDDRPYYGNATPQTMSQIFSALGPSAAQYPQPGWPGGLPYQQLALGIPTATPPVLPYYREQAAYVIAQWAINVVDFRDRDSIMTPFEFDLYPFRGDDPLHPNVTWNVDDIIDPLPSPATSDDAMPWRGLVWGCERPELLMTETVAFHDRGTANTTKGQPVGGNSDTYYDPNNPAATDLDYDQVRRPRGSLIVELFNPTNCWDAPQLDLQTSNVVTLLQQQGQAAAKQPWEQPDGNGNQGYGINLAQVATAPPVGLGPAASPVWRIVIAYSPTLDESNFYNTPVPTAPQPTPPAFYAGGNGRKYSPAAIGNYVDPRVPILPPGAIHRAVYFAPYQAAFINAAGGIGPASVVADAFLSSSFFADPNAFNLILPNPPALLLPPGQYALVAPATQLAPPAGNFMVYAGAAPTGLQSSAWSLQMGLGGVYNTVSRLNTSALAPSNPYASGYPITTGATATIKPVIGVPIQTTWFSKDSNGNPIYMQHVGVTAAANPTTTLRMSVSEPEHGYPVWPTMTPVLSDDAAYYSTTLGQPTSGDFPQHPFDSPQQNNNTQGATLQFGDSPNPYTAPKTSDTSNTNLKSPTQNQPWTQPGYTVLYLQRLANPLQPWDSKANPYITVDSMPVDLTAYTGEPAPPGAPTKNNTMILDPAVGLNPGIDGSNTTPTFDTRRRGYNATGTSTIYLSQGTPNIWPSLPTSLMTLASNPFQNQTSYGNQFSNKANSTTVLSNPMPITEYCSLGYLNAEYAPGIFPAGVYTGAVPAPVGTSGMLAEQYNGDPTTPMPWLAWNNRPYISQYELMLVPASSPSSQLQDFGMLGWNAGTALNEYQPYTTNATGAPPGYVGMPTANSLPAAQFMQLLNFFNSEQTLTTQDLTNLLPNLYRIFEFLQVPSRFAGTQDMLDPSQFAGNDAVLATSGATGNGLTSHLFHTPFNWLSRYREPGKINLNTIFDPIVFKALADDYPGTLYGTLDPTTMAGVSSLWQRVFLSRQGFTLPTPQTYTMPPNPVSQFLPPAFNTGTGNYPTYFANPFRPDGAGAFSPPATWNPPMWPLTPPVWANDLWQKWSYPGTALPAGQYNGVNATLLRQSTTSTSLALFDDTSFDTTNLGATYASVPLVPSRSAAKDAAFQYQMFTRLGNTTTNRSNVYAIWITLGKFEVQSVAVSPQNPDGYKLVKPYLDAAGNQVTTRGFYIFDRSIPMGFQRGQDVNIERGMLVERVLQLPQ